MEIKNVDSRRIYLTGYSLGAEGTYDMIARNPALFACGVPVAGWADTSKAFFVISTPIWAFHGTEDKVIDIRYHQLAVKAIGLKQGRIRLTKFKGVGHDCKGQAYKQEGLWDWVFDQERVW